MAIDDNMAALVGFACEAFFYGSSIARTDNQVDCSFPFRVLYDSLRYDDLSKAELSTPAARCQQTYFHYQRVIILVLLHSLCFGV
jgi:hypothetical protein